MSLAGSATSCNRAGSMCAVESGWDEAKHGTTQDVGVRMAPRTCIFKRITDERTETRDSKEHGCE